MAQLTPRLLIDRRGTALIEFALLAPILIALLIGMAAYGHYFLIAHSAQQLANDAARASIAGLSAEEREDIARLSVQRGAGTVAGIDPAHILASVEEDGGAITVEVSVDARTAPLMNIPLVPMPSPMIRKRGIAHPGGVL